MHSKHTQKAYALLELKRESFFATHDVRGRLRNKTFRHHAYDLKVSLSCTQANDGRALPRRPRAP